MRFVLLNNIVPTYDLSIYAIYTNMKLFEKLFLEI